jgi:hypothetical protein
VGNDHVPMYDYGMAKRTQTRAEAERLRQLQLRRERHHREQQVTPNFKAGQQPNYFRQWRKYRRMTLEMAGELAGMTAGNISAMERGTQNYTQNGLEALARAYNCLPAQLLMVDPINSDIWSIWELAKTGLPHKDPPKDR